MRRNAPELDPLAISPDTLIGGRRICIMMLAMAIDLESARERMVLEQLERRGIKEPRVLDAMRTVPRHRFLPAELHDHAYDDGPLPIGDSQTISQPYMVALMSEVAELTGAEKVLEVGTGSGYQTAVLARLARTVYSVEFNAHLHDRARVILNSMVVNNVYLRCGDGSDGWPEEAPFDVVMVTAAMPGIALPLLNQLTPQGRLIAPIGEDELQTLVRISRKTGRWNEEYFGECRFVKMTGKLGFQD
jgi:protein-L-isoaspartate(D-aspartate) O-methyltransferase